MLAAINMNCQPSPGMAEIGAGFFFAEWSTDGTNWNSFPVSSAVNAQVRVTAQAGNDVSAAFNLKVGVNSVNCSVAGQVVTGVSAFPFTLYSPGSYDVQILDNVGGLIFDCGNLVNVT